jgi:hypothetical protein
MPKASASSGVILPAGIGRLRVRDHDLVDVGVVPHVERAGGAGADGDAQDRTRRAPGARTRVRASGRQNAVKITSDMTRGFSSAT